MGKMRLGAQGVRSYRGKAMVILTSNTMESMTFLPHCLVPSVQGILAMTNQVVKINGFLRGRSSLDQVIDINTRERWFA